MTSRTDCEHLPLSDRFYLTLSAIDMIEEGLSVFTANMLIDIVEQESDCSEHEVYEIVDDMRKDAYKSLLHTMVIDRDEAKTLTKMLRLHQRDQAE